MKTGYTLLIATSMLLLMSPVLLAQKKGVPGYISGSKVNMRKDHTITASPIALLEKGQNITILKSYRPEDNYNEAILQTSTDFYSEDYGYKVFTLQRGKAVLVQNWLQGDMVQISFSQGANGKIGYAKIQSNLLEFIGGDSWYFVETNGRRGWVFGKYVKFY